MTEQHIDTQLANTFETNPITPLPRSLLPSEWQQTLHDHYSENAMHLQRLQQQNELLRQALVDSRTTISDLMKRVTELENP